MTIETSILLFDSQQVDGRRWIEERHTDHLGENHYTRYLADSNHDTAASLTANAAAWEAQLEREELARNEQEIIG